jgi:phage virion morphogenesis protein
MDDEGLSEVVQVLDGLAAQVQPAEARRLTRMIANGLRSRNAERIAGQENLDGSAYEPRKPLRDRRGRILDRQKTGPMFRQIRKLKHLGRRASADEAAIGFFDRVTSRIAGVHQHGLRDRVTREADAPQASYPKRELIGVTDRDRDWILDQALEHLES